MFRLSREVRIGINPDDGPGSAGRAVNAYAAHPPLVGVGHYFALRLTLAGEPDAASQYVLDIRRIDAAARERGIEMLREFARGSNGRGTSKLAAGLYERLADADWPAEVRLEKVELALSPFLSVSCFAEEHPMTRLSQKFEFSAAPRLHNPALSDAENREVYGKCNNPLGHGHNYEVQVTLAGTPDESGVLIDVGRFERTVAEVVIDRFDHKHLNEQVAEFQDVIPSVENIARVIYGLLKPHFSGNAKLAGVTVWETPKTWCEYGE